MRPRDLSFVEMNLHLAVTIYFLGLSGIYYFDLTDLFLKLQGDLSHHGHREVSKKQTEILSKLSLSCHYCSCLSMTNYFMTSHSNETIIRVVVDARTITFSLFGDA